MKNIFSGRALFKDFFLTFLIQFAILIAALVLYALILGSPLNSNVLQEIRIVGGEETAPHLARLIYMIFAFCAGIAGIFIVQILEKKEKSDAAFWAGIISGLFLWQSIGECSWHFAIPCFTEGETVLNYLPRIEGPSAAMLIIPYLVVLGFLIKNKTFSFGMLALILSFTGNWAGHFISVGTFPVVSRLIEETSWYKLSGTVYGLVLAAAGLFNAIKEGKNRQQKMIWSIVFYFGIAAIPLAFMEG
ncbi:MAG: hypothetical protein MJ159_05900 [Treponemataceae bacterium]|nr:hypothetical protein [Treponemataceae bacterium]